MEHLETAEFRVRNFTIIFCVVSTRLLCCTFRSAISASYYYYTLYDIPCAVYIHYTYYTPYYREKGTVLLKAPFPVHASQDTEVVTQPASVGESWSTH